MPAPAIPSGARATGWVRSVACLALILLSWVCQAGTAVGAPATACRRELWIVADYSGSMYLPASQFNNRVQYQGRQRNLLEASALAIDEALEPLPPDIRVRIFSFYSTIHEVPVPDGALARGWFFSHLDRNRDGAIDALDDPGDFKKSKESKTNLAGAFDRVFKELAALPEDRRQAVGILFFTDGDADYIPPGFGRSGRDFVMESSCRDAPALAGYLQSRNAVLRVVALLPNLLHARDVVKECLAPAAGDRVRFLPASAQLAVTVRRELDDLIQQLSRLDVLFSGFTPGTGGGGRLALDVANGSCIELKVARAKVVFMDQKGHEVGRASVEVKEILHPGESRALALPYDRAGVADATSRVQVALEDATGRVLGQVGPVRYIDERVTWRLEAEQSGLQVSGKVSIVSVVGAPASVKLASFQLRGRDNTTYRVAIEGKVWDQVPSDRDDVVQGSDFEFHFRLPEELVSKGDAEYGIEPELVPSRTMPLRRGSVSIRLDPALGLGDSGESLSYRLPQVEQGSVGERQSREADIVWVVPLRVVRHRSFLGAELRLDGSTLSTVAGEVPITGASCTPFEGSICLWTLTGKALTEALPPDATGRLDVVLRLRSSQAQVSGETRIAVDRPAAISLNFERAVKPRREAEGVGVFQATFGGPISDAREVKAGRVAVVAGSGTSVAAAPYYRKKVLDRLVAARQGKEPDPKDRLPVVWLQPESLLRTGSVGTRGVSLRCDNRNKQAVTLEWEVANLGGPVTQTRPVAGQPLTLSCEPGSSVKMLQLPVVGELSVVRMRLLRASVSSDSLPAQVSLAAGPQELRLTGTGDLFVVLERRYAWGVIGLILIILAGLAAGVYRLNFQRTARSESAA